MLYVVAGLILGILAGFNLDFVYNPEYVVYISLAILAIINTIFNILSENIKGQLSNFKSCLFLITDLLFAILLGFVGEQLGLPIYLAAVFAFGNNIYKNIRVIIDFFLEKYNKNR